MKKTVDAGQTVSVILKYLLHFISVALFYGIALYSTIHFWVGFLIKKFSHVYYVSGVFDKQLVILLIVYSLFCYFSNNFLLHLYRKERSLQLVLSMIIDELLLPVSILLMIMYGNYIVKTPEADTSNLYNIYAITILLIIKEIIASWILSGKKDNQNNSLKLKPR